MHRADYGLPRKVSGVELQIDNKSVFIATGNKEISSGNETVLFVHGAGQSHTIWVLPTRYFARKGYNVISVDLPGHGKTSGPCLPSIEAMADWLTRVLDAIAVEQTAIVGHSMGSLVGLAMAATDADRARSLAMIGTSVPMPVNDALLSNAENNDHAAVEMLTYWGHSSSAHLGGNPLPGIWMLGSGMRLMEQAGDGVIHADLNACNEYTAGLEHAAQVRCPAMLILGQRDMMTPVRATKGLAAKIANVETVVLEGSGHALLSERPDPVLDALIRIV